LGRLRNVLCAADRSAAGARARIGCTTRQSPIAIRARTSKVFLVDGEDVLPTRVYAWPPIVSGGAWFLNGHGIGLESTVTAETISSRAGATFDPTRGQLRVGLLDCSGSFTRAAAVRLDGQPPDAFLTEPPLWVEDAPSPRPLFVNVEPGPHVLSYVAEETGLEEAALPIVIESGTITSVVGMGPSFR